MKYSQGKAGRIFVARVEHGDNLIEELKSLVEQERIEAAVLYLIGALQEAFLVVGPEASMAPPVPVWRRFDDSRELLAIGTMFRDEEGPVFHIHSTLGKGDTVLTGCIRGPSKAYLVVEAIILELLETGAVKELDQATGLKALRFSGGPAADHKTPDF